MMKYFCLAILLLASCVNNNREISNEKSNELAYYLITNESLIDEIVKFSEEFEISSKAANRIICIRLEHIKDTVKYQLNYSRSAFGVASAPATVFSQVNGLTIAVTFGMPYERNDFKLPDSIAWLYIKDIFKNEYEYYLKYNDYPPPPTGSGITWILHYKHGTLIKKEEKIW